MHSLKPTNHFDSFKAITLASLSAACFGLSIVITKSILSIDTGISPLVLLTLQSVFSVVFLWGLVGCCRLRVPMTINALKAGTTGLLEPGLSSIFGIFGLALTTASNAALMNTIEPILTIALAAWLLRERISRSLFSLTGIACIGVGFIAFPDLFGDGQSSFFGDGLIVLAVSCAALYAVATRPLANQFHSLILAALQQTFALIWFLIVLIVSRITAMSYTGLSVSTIALAALSGILGYGVAFWLYLLALQRQTASVTSIYLTLIPVFSVTFAYLFLGERLAPIQGFGGALILFVVFGISKLPLVGSSK